MSQKPRPAKSQHAATPATLAVPRKTRSGRSSMRCWTSEPRKPGVALPEAGSPGWKSIMKTYVIIAVGGVSAMIAVAAIGQTPTPAPSGGSSVVDANGNLHVPDDYRATYQFLGSWAVASDRGPGSKELHV